MFSVVSSLLALPGFDMVEGTAIDWMHVICLGITRGLLDKWLNSSDERYSIGDKVQMYSHYMESPHSLFLYFSCNFLDRRSLYQSTGSY